MLTYKYDHLHLIFYTELELFDFDAPLLCVLAYHLILDRLVPKELTDIRGYQQFRLDRTCNGGGVSVYVRDSAKAKHRFSLLRLSSLKAGHF